MRHPDDLAFPRRAARTRSFTNGRPRDVTVSPDGERVVFLRSDGPEDAANALWVLDVATGRERLVVGASGEGPLTPAERARREQIGRAHV